MSLMRTVHVQRIASTARMPSSAHRQARGCVARNASVAQCGYAPDVRMRQSGCVYALGYNDALGDSAQGRSCATGSAHRMASALPLAIRVCRGAYGQYSARAPARLGAPSAYGEASARTSRQCSAPHTDVARHMRIQPFQCTRNGNAALQAHRHGLAHGRTGSSAQAHRHNSAHAHAVNTAHAHR